MLTTQTHDTPAASSALARKLARSEAGLAPEDQTLGQATYTACQRQDPSYLQAWIDFESDYDAYLQDLQDYSGRHGL